MLDLGGDITGPALLNGELYLGAQGNEIDYHALNAQTGKEDWYASVPGYDTWRVGRGWRVAPEMIKMGHMTLCQRNSSRYLLL